MISFVLLFALAFAAFPVTDKAKCDNIQYSEWKEASQGKAAECTCLESFTEKTEGTTYTCFCDPASKEVTETNQGVKKCVVKCDANKKLGLKDDYSGCECKFGYQENTGSDKATNPCVCPETTHVLINGQCQKKLDCSKNTDGKTLLQVISNECVAACDGSDLKIGNECVRKTSCEEGSGKPLLNTENNQCVAACLTGQLKIGSECQKKATCSGASSLLNTEDNKCVASCKAEQLKIGNECQQKQSCNGASNKPLLDETTNQCVACPQNTPIFHSDARKCIAQADCKRENAETLQDTSVANLKVCSCVQSASYNNGKCNPECGDTCGKPNQKCQFKSDFSDTECVCGNGYQANTGADKATNPCVCPTATHEEKTVSNVKQCVAKAPTCDAAKHQKLNTAGNACECIDGYQANTGADKTTNPCTCPTATHEEKTINNAKKCVIKCDAAKHEKANAAGNACECETGYENKPLADKKLNCVLKCGENEELKNGKCECKTGFEKKNNKCVKKENNGVNGLFVILAMALFFIF